MVGEGRGSLDTGICANPQAGLRVYHFYKRVDFNVREKLVNCSKLGGELADLPKLRRASTMQHDQKSRLENHTRLGQIGYLD